MTVAEKIKSIRAKNNLSQAQFAEIVGVKVLQVKNWEHSRYYPRMEMLLKILDIFNETVTLP